MCMYNFKLFLGGEGVLRIEIGLVYYEETRGALKVFWENVIRNAVTYTEHAKKKTRSHLEMPRPYSVRFRLLSVTVLPNVQSL